MKPVCNLRAAFVMPCRPMIHVSIRYAGRDQPKNDAETYGRLLGLYSSTVHCTAQVLLTAGRRPHTGQDRKVIMRSIGRSREIMTVYRSICSLLTATGYHITSIVRTILYCEMRV